MYRYQMHVHTTPCSLCGAMSHKELCEALKKNGYQGTVLTNHFFHGNTGIDRALPWEEFVRAYENDYLACMETAKEYDLDIIFGIEEVVIPGLEILCYGITPSVLYDNPQLKDCSIDEWVNIMRQNGVVLIQAHPFRQADYIPNPGPLPIQYYDGVEVYNLGNKTPEMNNQAMEYADAHPHLLKTSSADAHWGDCVPFGGIAVKNRIKTEKELALVLKSREYELIFGKVQ